MSRVTQDLAQHRAMAVVAVAEMLARLAATNPRPIVADIMQPGRRRGPPRIGLFARIVAVFRQHLAPGSGSWNRMRAIQWPALGKCSR
jgi:hypothetical protein